MHFAHSTPSVQHTPSAHASPDVSGTRPGVLNRSRSSTSSPMRTGPRVHFGLNPSRRPSPLEHRFERRLTALEDSVTSMHVRMSAEFLDIRASIRSINQALVDLKSSLTEQIRAGFAEMRSNMPVQQDNDYSITYTRGRKRKASEADFGVDDNLAREIGSTSQTLHIFEPNLPVITEESSEGVADNLGREIGSSSQTQQIFEPNLQAIPEESAGDIKVTPDARMSGGEATTSRDAGVRSLGETVTLKVNNSLARVRASMLDRSPSRIRGFYAEYEKSFYGLMAIANSRVTFFHIGEALRGLLEMQIRHPEVMSADDSLMDRHFYGATSVLAEAKDIDFNINLAPIVRKVKGDVGSASQAIHGELRQCAEFNITKGFQSFKKKFLQI
ncbi:uncharacterized protein [Primulina eburnea]|uniref:uncharacterized protein n=1 Tax=Primulina eburnea TaxID=1245227 RepID=UPI003C6C20D3